MKKRIFSNMLLLAIISLLVVSVALCMVFYMQLSSSVQIELRGRATMLKEAITSENYHSFDASDMRLTIVAPDGTVLYDNGKEAEMLPNHADREEIAAALKLGVGESHRFSDTLGQETYYYAVKMGDGSVLRLAKSMSSIWGMFAQAIPVVFFVVLVMFVISYFSAANLTKRIVNPINKVHIDKNLTTPYDELIPLVRTISQQREQISQQMFDLQTRSNTAEAIMDNMSEGIILVDKKGFVLSINKSAAAIFSLPVSSEGHNILEILRDAELNESMRSALSGIRGEINLIHNKKTYRVYFSPVIDSGAIILFLDITEKFLSEKLRREFSANVSHELKTPLTTISGNAEMLQSGMVKEADKAQFYGKIKDEAARLIDLIEDIIMLSRLDETSGHAAVEDVNLFDAAAEVIESLESKAKEQNVAVTISGDGIFPANRSQIVELFYNLIDNSIKYNKPDGTVNVEISVLASQAKIIVSDTGIGIPQEAQDRVFERFYRLDKSRSKKTGGTGLGLAIVKHIALVYSGSIELQSSLNKGTKIVVLLNNI